jgi:hypothetical protein
MPFLEKDVMISYPLKRAHYSCRGLWDTGATATMISKRIVDTLALEPISVTEVIGFHGMEEREVYSITFILAKDVAFEQFPVIGAGSLMDEHEVLIGMDIISQLDFAITNFGGQTTHSIRYPSFADIDFEAEKCCLNNDMPIARGFGQLRVEWPEDNPTQ